eukprot:5361200-Pleurochrysis_carterae.AAC.4
MQLHSCMLHRQGKSAVTAPRQLFHRDSAGWTSDIPHFAKCYSSNVARTICSRMGCVWLYTSSLDSPDIQKKTAGVLLVLTKLNIASRFCTMISSPDWETFVRPYDSAEWATHHCRSQNGKSPVCPFCRMIDHSVAVEEISLYDENCTRNPQLSANFTHII